jgi:hypothetical protein
MGRLNKSAGMSAYMSDGQAVWWVKWVTSEPTRAPGCYKVLRNLTTCL